MQSGNGKILKIRKRRPIHLFAGALLFFSLLSACSNPGPQVNEKPLLASSWGGTGGGPINGALEVMVFDDSLHVPIPGAVVSLGSSGATRAKTDSQGIANFEGVFGPQDIHIFFCSDCGPGGQLPLPYEAASFYQVNASHLAVPLFTRDPSVSEGAFQGKVFDVNENEGVFQAAIDETGKFIFTATPLLSTTYNLIDEETPADSKLTFVHSSDLDRWAAADPAAGRQEFSAVAVLGTAIGPSGQPQGGVHVEARYFSGNPGGRAYYFDDRGLIDPALDVTSGTGPAAGRFVFLRLFPNNDFILAGTRLGTGIGTRYFRLPEKGTAVVRLPVLPSTTPVVDLFGRVVEYRPNYREEEKKGPFSTRNVGVPAALISISGDTLADAASADRGPGIDGNYRIERRLLPHSRYVAVVLSGRGYRQTYQDITTTDRSKFNYPIAAVLLDGLITILRDARIPDTPDENGNPRFRVGLLPGHGEIIGRIVEPTGRIDDNGDPILQPVKDATVSVTDENGKEVRKLDEEGREINNIFYLTPEGSLYVDQNGNGSQNPDGTMNRTLGKTSEGGGFIIFDLPAPETVRTAAYSIIAKDAAGREIIRKTVTVYADGVRLLELEKKGAVARANPVTVVDANITPEPVGAVSLSLAGGKLECADVPCRTDETNGTVRAALPAVGDYVIKLNRQGGGGDYQVSFAASKRRIGFTAFRYSGSSVNNVTFQGGLGPLNPGRELQNDIVFFPPPPLPVTTGNLFLPPTLAAASRTVLIGAVGPQGLVFVGLDAGLFLNPSPQYRAVSLPSTLALSYFVIGFAQSAAGESSTVFSRGFPQIPEALDLAFGTPPKLLSPKGQSGVGATPRLSWSPPDEGPPDLYRLFIETAEGMRLWQGWAPGNVTEVTPAAVPAAFPEIPPVLSAGTRAKWVVHAIRAGGLNYHEFTFKELGDRRVGDSSASSDFVP